MVFSRTYPAIDLRTDDEVLLLLLSALAICSHGQNADSLVILDLTRGSKGTLADTVRIEALLDSAKAWVSTGEIENSVTATNAALELIGRIPGEFPSLRMRSLAILLTLATDGNLANTYSGLGTIHFESAEFDKAMAPSIGER